MAQNNLFWCILVGLTLALQVSSAVQTLPSPQRKHGKEVQEAFEPVRAALQKCSAVVYADSPREAKDLINKDRIAFATVMSPDGYLFTKASELQERSGLMVRVGEQSYDAPEIVATNDEWDLALLKINAEGLTPPEWIDEEPSIGTWVVSNGASSRWRRRVKAGIISAKTRQIPEKSYRAVIGVVFDESDELTIKEVNEKSGAARAGVKPGDKIITIDAEPIEKPMDIREKLEESMPGEVILLGVQRANERLVYEVELSSSVDLFGEDPPDRNDGMSGRFSDRRTNFPMVLQHDIPFSRISTGGPLLNLQGQGIGINIARANRAETFAIPTKHLLKIYQEMRPR